MSGILGVFYRDGRPVKQEYLEQMRRTLAHRGSDNTDVWLNESIGLGNCLRWTTPESLLEFMPRSDRFGNVITGDLRLDNRAELISSLDFDRSDRDKITDSELVLAAYQKWGRDCVNKLLGDFAFAIWNERSQQIFCARDYYGVKQLYYYCSDRVMAFATEIKALFCIPEVPRRLNEVKIADYLLPLFEDREITFYQDIYRLPPAHYLTVDREQKQLKQYWSFDPARNITLGSDREYAEAFRELFTEAVSCRMRSAFPVGTLLSGGLDSSSITCVARNLLKHQLPLPTFSAVFDRVTECDESSYINSVVQQGGIESHLIRGDRFGPLSDWQQMTWHQDEAYYAPNLFLHCELYRAAQQQNVRVLLDGFDGDTTVSHGIAYLAELTRTGNLLYLIPEVMGLAKNFERSPLQMLWRHGLEPIVHPKVRRLGNKIISRNKSSQKHRLILQGDFARRIQLKQRIQHWREVSQLPKTSREAHYQRLTSGVMPFALEAVDKAAAAFGIEPRYPFFDKRLTEFCLALPSEQKLHRGWTRIVMRRAMAGILPPKIQWRGGKSNLGPNFQHGLQLGREKLEQILDHDLTLIEDYVELNSLRSLYRRFEADENLSHDDFLTIWKSFSLTLWLKDVNLHT